jgi:hypothetical protein
MFTILALYPSGATHTFVLQADSSGSALDQAMQSPHVIAACII